MSMSSTFNALGSPASNAIDTAPLNLSAWLNSSLFCFCFKHWALVVNASTSSITSGHRRWRREGQGGHGPHFYGTLFARKDRDTLIEQSGSGYSNRAVTVFREAV